MNRVIKALLKGIGAAIAFLLLLTISAIWAKLSPDTAFLAPFVIIVGMVGLLEYFADKSNNKSEN